MQTRLVLATLGVVTALALGACSSATTKPGRTVTATVTATPAITVTAHPVIRKVIATHTRVRTETYTPPPPHQYGAGTYVVGTDIKPGLYKTRGGDGCYWARLSSLDTDSIKDNNLSDGPQTVQIKASDKAFEISGSCTFGRA